MSKLLFDVLIPALNEEEALPHVLDPLCAIQRRTSSLEQSTLTLRHIWVVDNGSEDATAAIAQAKGALVVHEPRRGYGRACLSGIEAIGGDPPDILLFVDADGSDDLNELDTLLTALSRDIEHLDERFRAIIGQRGRAELVIGSRPRYAHPEALTSLQRFGNRLSCWLLKRIFNVHFTDLGPLRAITWSGLQSLRMSDEDFGWTVEMQAKAAALKLKCVELDVQYLKRYAGKSKISGTLLGSFFAGKKILLTIAKAWWIKDK